MRNLTAEETEQSGKGHTAWASPGHEMQCLNNYLIFVLEALPLPNFPCTILKMLK